MSLTVAYVLPAYGSAVHPGVWMQGIREAAAAADLGYELQPGWLDQIGIDMTRNQILEVARKSGDIDFVFFQDADVWAGTAVIPSLLDVAHAHKAAAVAVACPTRKPGRVLNVVPVQPGEVYRAEAAGSGMLLVDLEALDTAEARGHAGPWFRRSYLDERETALVEGGDVFFGRRLAELGLDLWVDARHHVSHASRAPITFDPTPGVTGATVPTTATSGDGQS